MGYEDWPAWLQTRLDLFPGEPLATYAPSPPPDEGTMRPGDVFTVELLVLTRGYLCGYKLTISRSSQEGVAGECVAHSVPLGAIRSVVAKEMGVRWQMDTKLGDYEATIELDRSLPPFNQTIRLIGDEGKRFIASLVEAKG